jgi:Cu-Zn family superoxide dismutase
MGKALLVGALAIGVAAFAGCKKSEESTEAYETSEAPSTEPSPAATVTTDIAAAQLSGPGGASGMVTFTPEPGSVHVVAQVSGLPPGMHGFHLHAGTTCDGPDFKTAGDHFNPTGANHGDPLVPPHHAGDFGNIDVGADGTANVDFTTTMLTLGDGGSNDVLGHAVIVHAAKDDLTTQPSGNSGARVACGVVQRAQGQAVTETGTPAPPPPAASSTPQS